MVPAKFHFIGEVEPLLVKIPGRSPSPASSLFFLILRDNNSGRGKKRHDCQQSLGRNSQHTGWCNNIEQRYYLPKKLG